jgi:hypothetical protein
MKYISNLLISDVYVYIYIYVYIYFKQSFDYLSYEIVISREIPCQNVKQTPIKIDDINKLLSTS